MKRILRAIAIVAGAGLFVSVVMAQQKGEKKVSAKSEAKPAAAAAEMMPKPSPEMEKLSKWLVGTWKTDEKHEPSEWMPQGGTGKGTETVRPGPGGLSVIADYKSQGAMGSFVGHGLTWWDTKEKAYKSLWCDSMSPAGCEMSGTGRWQGKDLVFTSTGEFNGKKVRTKMFYTDITTTSFTFAMDMAVGGGPSKRTMTIKYNKGK